MDARTLDRYETARERSRELIALGWERDAAWSQAEREYDAKAGASVLRAIPHSLADEPDEARLLAIYREMWVAERLGAQARAWREHPDAKSRPPFDADLARKDLEREYDRNPRMGLDMAISTAAKNREAYTSVEKRSRELQAEGHILIEADAQAIAEMLAGTLDDSQGDVDACEDCGREHDDLGESVISLMDANRKVTSRSHSSKGRKKKPAPRGAPYQNIEAEPRSEWVHARVTESTKRDLDEIQAEMGLNGAALLAAVARAHSDGRAKLMQALRELAPRPKDDQHSLRARAERIAGEIGLDDKEIA